MQWIKLNGSQGLSMLSALSWAPSKPSVKIEVQMTFAFVKEGSNAVRMLCGTYVTSKW